MVQDKYKNLILKDTIDIIFTGRFDENKKELIGLDLAIENKLTPNIIFKYLVWEFKKT